MKISASTTFEHKTADAIRNLTVACIILSVGLVLTLGLSVWGFARASDANRAVKAGLVQQTTNRTTNVAHWCGAINALDHSLTGYVALFHHVPRLHLVPLNCAALERATLASTKPH